MASAFKSLKTAIAGKGEFASILDELRSIFYEIRGYAPAGSMKPRLTEVRRRLNDLRGREAEKNVRKIRALDTILFALDAMDREQYDTISQVRERKLRINTNVGEHSDETLKGAQNMLLLILREMDLKKQATVHLEELEGQYFQMLADSFPVPPSASQTPAQRNAIEQKRAAAVKWLRDHGLTSSKEDVNRIFERIQRVYGYSRNMLTKHTTQDSMNTAKNFFLRRNAARKKLGVSEKNIDDTLEGVIKAMLEKDMVINRRMPVLPQVPTGAVGSSTGLVYKGGRARKTRRNKTRRSKGTRRH